jgi:hypothetical protein
VGPSPFKYLHRTGRILRAEFRTRQPREFESGLEQWINRRMSGATTPRGSPRPKQVTLTLYDPKALKVWVRTVQEAVRLGRRACESSVLGPRPWFTVDEGSDRPIVGDRRQAVRITGPGRYRFVYRGKRVSGWVARIKESSLLPRGVKAEGPERFVRELAARHAGGR